MRSIFGTLLRVSHAFHTSELIGNFVFNLDLKSVEMGVTVVLKAEVHSDKHTVVLMEKRTCVSGLCRI